MIGLPDSVRILLFSEATDMLDGTFNTRGRSGHGEANDIGSTRDAGRVRSDNLRSAGTGEIRPASAHNGSEGNKTFQSRIVKDIGFPRLRSCRTGEAMS